MESFERYLVFGFSDYYPKGGLDDVKTSCKTLVEVKRCLDLLNQAKPIIIEFENIQVFDCQERRILREEEYNLKN